MKTHASVPYRAIRWLWLPAMAILVTACGQALPDRPAARNATAVTALQERDTTSIRAIKTEIKRYFEVATLDRIIMVKTIAIVPAPAWNEFVYEAIMYEEDLTTGFFTFKVTGIYDGLAKTVSVKTRELIDFTRMDARAPRNGDRVGTNGQSATQAPR